MSNEILNGKVIKVTEDGNWNDFKKFIVDIENDKSEVASLNFLARGNFKKAVGDNIQYEIKNPIYKSAKLYYKPFNTNTI